MFIGVRSRGQEGLQPPQLQKFFGQNTHDSGKSTREKTLQKGSQSQTWRLLSPTFTLSEDGVTVKWSKDPGICFGKAIDRLHVCRRNPRNGYYVHQRDNDRIKTKTLTFLWWLWKEPLSMAPQRAVLKFSWTSRTRENLMFLLQVFDFTRQSIEVIEDSRFQNNYSWIPISRTFIFFNLPITQNKSRFPLPSWTLQF